MGELLISPRNGQSSLQGRPTEADRASITAVMVTDIVGSTDRVSQIGNEAWLELIRNHDRLLAAEVVLAGGRVLRSTGDGALCVFSAPQEAIRCSLRLHARLPEIGLQIRVGLHLGEVDLVSDNEIAGLAVHVAARIADYAQGGETLVSEALRGSLLGGSYRFIKQSRRRLRGVPGRWPLYLVGPDTDWETAVRGQRRARLGLTAVTALLLALALGLWNQQAGPVSRIHDFIESQLETGADRSIGVLPLSARGDSADDGYLAVGLGDEILTQLTKIAAFRVVEARLNDSGDTSGAALQRLGGDLKVRYVLKGSLQREPTLLRINLALIDVEDGSRVWAESYERRVDELVGLQSEVARSIAHQLRARLNDEEQQQLALGEPVQPEAYDSYLKGLAIVSRGGWGEVTMKSAVAHFQQANRLDPDFALAWSHLASALANLYITYDRSQTVAEQARQAVARAQVLAPDSLETLTAHADYVYLVEGRIGDARGLFEKIDQRYPGRSSVKGVLARIAQDQQRWDDAVALFEQALALDPQNRNVFWDLGFLLNALHRFNAAQRVLERALRLFPDDPPLVALKSYLLQAQGRLAEAEAALAVPGEDSAALDRFWARVQLLELQRRPADQLALLQSALPQVESGIELWLIRASIGQALQRLGRLDEATATLRQARQEAESMLAEQPESAFIELQLALICVLLDDHEAARRHTKNSAEFFKSNGALSEAMYDELVAYIETRLGEPRAALARLKSLHDRPTDLTLPLTAAVLRLDPRWDDLRRDPAFEEVLPDDP